MMIVLSISVGTYRVLDTFDTVILFISAKIV